MKTLLTTLTIVLIALTVPEQSVAQNSPDRRVLFSTFHGGDRHDAAAAVAVDSAGHIFVTGTTESRNLRAAVVGGKSLKEAVPKIYLTKYTPNGKEVLWRVLIGGDANTMSRALTTDREGNVFVAGSTQARDLPMKNPIQDKHGSNLAIAFLMKFSPQGDLLFSTLLGGERLDEPRALAMDSKGNLYMAGRASSTTFPVQNALQPKYAGGVDDAFIVKLRPDLTIAYSTFLGGAGSDHIHAIAVGSDDSLYVVGESSSKGLATAEAYIREMQPYSSFAARIAADGQSIIYYTYIGWRSGYSIARALAVDAQGQAWIGGDTTAKQLPTTPSALQKNYGSGQRDGFLLRLTAKGNAANYVTFLGGNIAEPSPPDETVNAIRVLTSGHVQVVGRTNAVNFLTYRPLQSKFGGAHDAFLVRFDPDATDPSARVIHSTTWGGTKHDEAQAVASGPGEVVSIAGGSFSPDLPLVNAAQATIGSDDDAFIMQFCEPIPSYGGFHGELTAVIGQEKPQSIDLSIATGCPQVFPITGVPESSAGWVTPVGDSVTVPMKLRVDINPLHLAVGEHEATIRVTVPDAFRPVLEIPIRLRVVEPKPVS